MSSVVYKSEMAQETKDPSGNQAFLMLEFDNISPNLNPEGEI